MNNKQLKEARQMMGFTVSEMCEALGVSDKRTYRRWESGEYDIPGSIAKLVSYILRDFNL